MANPAVQPPPLTVGVSINPLADVDFPDSQPISQLRSPAVEIHDISSLPQLPPTPPTSPILILDEQFKAYFRAPITQPPHGSSSPVHHHL